MELKWDKPKPLSQNRFPTTELKYLPNVSSHSYTRKVAETSQCELSFDDDVDLDQGGPSLLDADHSFPTESPCSIHCEVPHEAERSFFGELEDPSLVEREIAPDMPLDDRPLHQDPQRQAYQEPFLQVAVNSQSGELAEPFESDVTPIKERIARHHSFSVPVADEPHQSAHAMMARPFGLTAGPRKLDFDANVVMPEFERDQMMGRGNVLANDNFVQELNYESSRLRDGYAMRMEAMGMNSPLPTLQHGHEDENRLKRGLDLNQGEVFGDGIVNKMAKMNEWSNPHARMPSEANRMDLQHDPNARDVDPNGPATKKAPVRMDPDEFEHLISLDLDRSTLAEEAMMMKLSSYASSASGSGSSSRSLIAPSLPTTPTVSRTNHAPPNRAKPPMALQNNNNATNSSLLTTPPPSYLQPGTANNSMPTPPPYNPAMGSKSYSHNRPNQPTSHYSRNVNYNFSSNNNNSNSTNSSNVPKQAAIPQVPKASNPTPNTNSSRSNPSQGPGNQSRAVEERKPDSSGNPNINSNRRRKLRGRVKPNETNCNESNFWGLPTVIKEIFENRNITQFYAWQLECLSMKEMIEHKSVLCGLPTSGGKTLIAEITILRTAIVQQKKSLFVLPYVSIVIEKKQSLEEFGQLFSFSVEAFYGSEGQLPVPPGNHVCIATIEKANAIVNGLIEEKRLSELGCLVVDEIHMLNVEGRGYLLEIILTKVLYVGKMQIQIIGMSATLPNLRQVAQWLDARPYVKAFRPVPLVEYYKVSESLYSKDGTLVRALDQSQSTRVDPDDLVALCAEVLPQCSVLIFCASKQSCQSTAEMLAKTFPEQLREYKSMERALMVDSMRAQCGNIDDSLKRVLACGIGYHHSGLTAEERECIEIAFKERCINVICCTSTLAAGVNLPARRVIIRSLNMGIRRISVQEYRQMCGRAGRTGIDTQGDSILILKPTELAEGQELIRQRLADITSALLDHATIHGANPSHINANSNAANQSKSLALPSAGNAGSFNANQPESLPAPISQNARPNVAALRKLVLEAICGIFVETECSEVSILNYLSYSFMAQLVDEKRLQEFVRPCIDYLLEKRFIQEKDRNEDQGKKKGEKPEKANATDGNTKTNSNQASTANEKKARDSSRSANASNASPSVPLYEPMPLGLATHRSSFSPDEALTVHAEISGQMRKGIILQGDLHLVYLLTPIANLPNVADWQNYFRLYHNLPEEKQEVGARVGLSWGYLQNRNVGGNGKSCMKNAEEAAFVERVTQRFYVALVLHELIHEVPVWTVAKKYLLPRGDIEALQLAAASFAKMMVSFCTQLKWDSLAALLTDYAKRLGFGVKAEVIPLLEIKGVGASRARSLYAVGYRTVRSISSARVEDLIRLIPRLGTFGDKAAKGMIASAKRLLEAKAAELRKEADELVNPKPEGDDATQAMDEDEKEGEPAG